MTKDDTEWVNSEATAIAVLRHVTFFLNLLLIWLPKNAKFGGLGSWAKGQSVSEKLCINWQGMDPL